MGPDEKIKDANHALTCGLVWGALMKIASVNKDIGKFSAMPVLEGGEYTNELILERPSGKYLIEIHQMETEEE